MAYARNIDPLILRQYVKDQEVLKESYERYLKLHDQYVYMIEIMNRLIRNVINKKYSSCSIHCMFPREHHFEDEPVEFRWAFLQTVEHMITLEKSYDRLFRWFTHQTPHKPFTRFDALESIFDTDKKVSQATIGPYLQGHIKVTTSRPTFEDVKKGNIQVYYFRLTLPKLHSLLDSLLN